MTVKEFSQKYGVDYSTVYNATWLIKSQTDSLRYRQYDETELLNAVHKTLSDRIHRHENELSKAKAQLKRLL